MTQIINDVKAFFDVFNKIQILDKNAVMQPFYNGQVTGFKIIFDCVLTNSAIKYIYDVCENEYLSLRLTTNADNKFNLLIFKNIK